jgi:tyrosinase
MYTFAICADVLTCWHRHTLTRDEKLAYIDAEKCLMIMPAKLGLKGPRTRFDEF